MPKGYYFNSAFSFYPRQFILDLRYDSARQVNPVSKVPTGNTISVIIIIVAFFTLQIQVKVIRNSLAEERLEQEENAEQTDRVL